MGRKSKAEEKRNRIIWALYACLSKKGHETVSIKNIANQADLAPGVIHYYFDRKEQIITGLIRSIQETYQARWDETLKNGSREIRINTGIVFLADEMIMDSDINRVLYNLVQMGFENTSVRTALKKAYRVYRENLAELFFQNASPKQKKNGAAFVLALVEGLALQWMIEPGFIEAAQIRKRLQESINPVL